ncbi:hypothetical protein LTR81_009214 [Elasticomyces elasticus]
MPKKKRQGSGAVTASKRTLRSQTKAKDADIDEQNSAFLALPPELRNTIYELALLRSDHIPVVKELQIPHLLHVSRQVKKEASGIWYEGNRFRHDIRNCDAELFQRFVRHCKSLEMEVTEQLRIYEVPNWSNLVAWSKQFHGGISRGLLHEEGFTKVETVIASAHSIFHDLNDQPWEMCEAMLKALRLTAGMLDQRWLA